jgi:hypothetical protein
MDIQVYIQELDENTAAMLQLAESCPDERLNKKTGDAWTIMEILEHIAITDRVVISLISKPSESMHTGEELFGKEKMHRLLVDLRRRKIVSPEGLLPKGNLTSIADFESIFTTQRDILKQKLQDGTIEVDNRMFKHPFLGDMPVADWLNFIIHHSLRHGEQIKDTLLAVEKNRS